MRKLASIQRITSIEPIAGADKIELVRLLGWQCVAQKGIHQVGNLVCYVEVDAVPPDTALFRWLWQPKSFHAFEHAKPGAVVLNTKTGETGKVAAWVQEPAADGFTAIMSVRLVDGPEWPTADLAVPRPANFRVRTMRLRGALSQGVLLPIAELPVGDYVEGQDVTEALGITKYDPPAPEGMGNYGGPFPGDIPKTDEHRVQAFPAVLDEMRGLPWVATVKMDGTSCTVFYDGEKPSVAGRNFTIAEGDNSYWRASRASGALDFVTEHPHLALQGEVVGPGIQKNRPNKPISLFVFNVYDRTKGEYLADGEARALCHEHAVFFVPIAYTGEAFEETVDSLLAKAGGVYVGTKNVREGIVIRPTVERRSTVLGGRLSFKAINNEFLLKGGD